MYVVDIKGVIFMVRSFKGPIFVVFPIFLYKKLEESGYII